MNFGIFNTETKRIEKIVKCFSGLILKTDKILDAGAGTKQYEHFFSHCNYESCDSESPFWKDIKHTFYCDLHNIPVNDNNYDFILCTQVLEHVESPELVLKEFYRILRPGGQIVITVPYCWALHAEPRHFQNFSEYGFKILAKNTNFKIIHLSRRGGVFGVLNAICLTAERNIFKPFFILAAPIFFLLDKFECDKIKSWTIGYNIILQKM